MHWITWGFGARAWGLHQRHSWRAASWIFYSPPIVNHIQVKKNFVLIRIYWIIHSSLIVNQIQVKWLYFKMNVFLTHPVWWRWGGWTNCLGKGVLCPTICLIIKKFLVSWIFKSFHKKILKIKIDHFIFYQWVILRNKGKQSKLDNHNPLQRAPLTSYRLYNKHGR